MRIITYTLLWSLITLMACQSQSPDLAQTVIDQAIAAQGGSTINLSTIDFDFRNRHYRASRENGQYQYERLFTIDSTGQKVQDVLTNQGLTRFVEGVKVPLSAKDSAAYANSVNSVIYFALLPYFLNDPAVQKTYLDSVTIKGQPYHKIKVSFGQEGGGKDYEDEYVYWFHRKTLTMDYLAYNYHTDEGGARFRQAYNARTISGIRFADYYNYEPVFPTLEVERFDRLFQQDSLKLLSEINTENIQVK